MEIRACPACGNLFVGAAGDPCNQCGQVEIDVEQKLTGLPWESALGVGCGSLEQVILEKMRATVRPAEGPIAEEAAACQKSLRVFMRHAWHVVEPETPFTPGWHIDCICEHLEAVWHQQIRNLLINMPPRHAKSLLVCVFWFCWVWTHSPASRWLYASYADSLATRDNRKCRDIVESPWYKERWGHVFRIRPGERAASKFLNDRRGYRVATSIGGMATGEGGDVLAVDDPMKASDAYSEAMRERVIRWWSETMSTRGNDPKTVRKVIDMQRLHERDLTGHMLAADLGYEHLCLPARYEPKRYFWDLAASRGEDGKAKMRDAIVLTRLQRQRPELRDAPEGSGRKNEGDLLWPARFGEEEIQKLEKELQAYGTAGQLQQRPAPEKGDIFQRDRFRSYTEDRRELVPGQEPSPCFVLHEPGREEPIVVPRAWCRFFLTADTALKVNETSKFTATLTAVLAPEMANGRVVRRHLLLHDAWRSKLQVPEQYAALLKRWRECPEALGLWVEDKASGIGLIQASIADGRPFTPLHPGTGDKVARAATVAMLYKSGLVWHRQGMAVRGDLEDELLSFPSGQYDDWVDCVSYAGILYVHDEILNADFGRDLVVWPDAETEREAQAENICKIGDVEVHFPADDRPWWEGAPDY